MYNISDTIKTFLYSKTIRNNYSIFTGFTFLFNLNGETKNIQSQKAYFFNINVGVLAWKVYVVDKSKNSSIKR